VSSVKTQLQPEHSHHETATGSCDGRRPRRHRRQRAGAPDAFSAQPSVEQEQACRADDGAVTSRIEATERILAYGYSEVSQLSKGCDNVWRALAFAEGDPVNVLVTPRGDVLTE
jgi:hypothetical protein